MSPITIASVKIEGFRAYLQPQVINLSRGHTPLSLAVFAPNAKGKSSLVDSLEYYFSKDGTLKRLGKRSAQTYAGPVAMEHVDAAGSDVSPNVHITFNQGKEQFDESRTVSTSPPPLPSAAERVLSEMKVHFIIRGHELRGFVENKTPEERYKEISMWFGLEPLMQIQRNLRALRREVKQSAESTSEVDGRLYDLKRLTSNAVVDWNETDVSAWFNSNVLAHLDKALEVRSFTTDDEGYQELVKRKSSEDQQLGLSGLNQLQTRVESLYSTSQKEIESAGTGRVVDFESAISRYEAAITREKDERSRASEVIFNNVWDAARQVFDDTEIEISTCPVCDTELGSTPHGSRDEIRVTLNAKLEGLREYRDAQTELANAKQQLDTTGHALRDDLDVLSSQLKAGPYSEHATYLTAYQEAINSWKPTDPAPESNEFVKVLDRLRAAICTDITRIKEQQGEHTYANALSTANRLIAIKTDLLRIGETKKELNALRAELDRQALVVNKAIVAHTRGLVGEIESIVDQLYSEIQASEEKAPPVRFELPSEEEKNQQQIQLLIDFAENRRGVVPSGYLSDSQIHTLALSLRLAVIRLFNAGAPIIVLDDIVTSYDADHRKSIAAVLAKHFPDFQIVLVTHDEQFFQLLQDHLPTAMWSFKRITRIEPKFGPKFRDHRTRDEEIQAKLDTGESAANEMRQAEEEWLLDICRGFGVKVIIRPVDRPYQFDRSELANALASFLKNEKLLPPAVEGISNNFLSSLQKGAVENFASHFSDNPYKNASVGDERVRWKEFRDFRDQFVCTNCGRRRFKRYSSARRPICSKCETPFSFSEKHNAPEGN